ncbi:uncharacterized protein ACA1_333160 [Acanthamoeba castellanii str. Neff]|uniref:Uncharacterized protein n=1 Tax=Acanthamoeba castellanii (strain ATCC 30010 / Neff) TaxID=1257118 RepID=L8HJ52_ACACF|nr:uncharacterized protein ACA1_333160 [Acanthamoeba castellanii str. Neff]ELR24436.1 hypothetical protein ACA1_333160 [Acanthamoeba castellanii str. Neff]
MHQCNIDFKGFMGENFKMWRSLNTSIYDAECQLTIKSMQLTTTVTMTKKNTTPAIQQQQEQTQAACPFINIWRIQ